MTTQQKGSTKKGKRVLSVYPHLRALQVLGRSAAGLNQALECWADLVGRATDRNAERFGPEEWCYLADCGNGTLWEPAFANPGALLAHQVRDADAFEGLGAKWLRGPAEVSALAEKLAGLGYAEAWAVILAVQFFWDHHEAIDVQGQEWWTLRFRAERDRSWREGAPGMVASPAS